MNDQPTNEAEMEIAAFTVQEFLIWARMGRNKFYDEVNEGNIKIRKLGRKTLILKTDAMAWLNALPEAA